MLGSMKSAICFLLALSLANAAQEQLILSPGQAIRSCNGGYDNNPALFLLQNPHASVNVRAIGPVDAKESSEWDLEVAVISTSDLDVTGFTSISGCPVGGAKEDCFNHVSFDKTYDQVISEKLNSSSLDVFQLSSKNDDAAFTHFVDPLVNYCVLITLNTPEKGLKLQVDVDWQPPSGQSMEDDFSSIYTYVFCFLALLLGSTVFFRYVFVKNNSLATGYRTEVDWTAQLKTKEIQARILVGLVGYSLSYFLHANGLFWSNLFGYSSTSFIAMLMDFLLAATNVLVIMWVTYNGLLFSAGYLLIPKSATGKQLSFIRVLTLSYFTSILSVFLGASSLEAHPVLIGIVIFVSGLGAIIAYICKVYWSIRTYFRLRSSGGVETARRYLATLSLGVFGFFLAIADAYLVGTETLTALHAFFLLLFGEVCSHLLTAYIWKDITIEAEKVDKGEV
ncbi:unnamed protein product [Kuraishia capsulata CBS 1993]|uniref:Uncharacterized protein n=1 Tax=Kuraishia capsulata CBS 1993 TaxID=1382522 RepID=W6MS44_9ASCO|nr:uncharacterized protein KUCA_T00004007001 [Kuraishia capsulata CBS 1993]CDK28027.1 unnamed protein product [Kuraishia capsulata CBS 1993]